MSSDGSAPAHPVRGRRRLLVALLVSATVVLPALGTGPAHADPRLEAARAHSQKVQARLDQLLQQLREADAEQEALRTRLEELTTQTDRQRTSARRADTALHTQARAAYMRGAADPTLSILASDSAGRAAEQSRLLGLLAERSKARYETAAAARVRGAALAREVEATAQRLRERRATLKTASREAEGLVAQAERSEREVRDVIAAEDAQRRALDARSRAGLGSAVSRARGAPAGAAVAAPGGVACPVGRPHSYTNSWGAARSGGRRHKGTDILASHGTPIYAYESGVVTRTNGSSLGGISLYLRGDSGNLYYYTHLAGYVSGIHAGARVSAGQHIARNGDTGNARGIPHLHFEVKPGGGGSTNPYPYVRRACG